STSDHEVDHSIAELAQEPLIVVNMAAENQIRHPLSHVTGMLDDVLQVLAPRMWTVSGIDRMVDGKDKSFPMRCRSQLSLKPVDLGLRELSSFRTIAVETDNGRELRVKCPVNVRLSHCLTG